MLISLKTTALAKEKGFNKQVDNHVFEGKLQYGRLRGTMYATKYFHTNKFAWHPTQEEICHWLRQQHQIFVQPSVEVYTHGVQYNWQVVVIKDGELSEQTTGLFGDTESFKSWEDATEAAITHSLSLIPSIDNSEE